MTKTEARTTGTERGVRFAETFTDEQLRGDLDAQRDNIAAAADESAIRDGFRHVSSPAAFAYVTAFRDACGMRFSGRRADLPEIKAQRRLDYVVRRLADGIEGAKEQLARFAADFAKKPAYALEWGTDAVCAAARQEVYEGLLGALNAQGVDAALQCARDAVMRRARWDALPRSTSPMANLMSAARLTAYAEFVDGMQYVESQ